MVYDGEKNFKKFIFGKQITLCDERLVATESFLHSHPAIKVQSKKKEDSKSWGSARIYLLVNYGYIFIYLTDNYGYALNLQKATAIKEKQCLSIKVKGAWHGQYCNQISLLFEQGEEVTLEFDDVEEHSRWWRALKDIGKSADVVAAAPKRKWGKAREQVRVKFHGDINDVEDVILAEAPTFFSTPAISHGPYLSTSRPKRRQWTTVASPDAPAESPHESNIDYANPTPDSVDFVSPPPRATAAAAEVDDDGNNEEDLLHKQAKITPLFYHHHRQAEELEIVPFQLDETFEDFNLRSSQQVAPPPNWDFLLHTPSPTRPPDAPTPRRSERLMNKKRINYKE